VQAESWREAVTQAQESCPECITVEAVLFAPIERPAVKQPVDRSSLLLIAITIGLLVWWAARLPQRQLRILGGVLLTVAACFIPLASQAARALGPDWIQCGDSIGIVLTSGFLTVGLIIAAIATFTEEWK
jgi:hypothetical protein